MSGIVKIVNQPVFKQGIKYAIGCFTCAIGTKALYDAINGKLYTGYAKSSIDRVMLGVAQVSFVMTAAVSPLGIWITSSVMNRIFSSAQLEKAFGPNTIFEANWKHPRHVVSLAAVGFALPLVLKRLFIPSTGKEETRLQGWAFFTIITSRPALHLGNQLAQKIFIPN
ncbi:MAG: hypothetical protein ACRDFB_08955, partial [Rhabdochlamydiaceae bacterium]